jgi:hypothetical protein
MSRLLSAAVAMVLASFVVAAEKPGRDRVDEYVGSIWHYTITKGEEKHAGQFRVHEHDVFQENQKVGRADPNGDETTITFTKSPELNGVAKLRKNRKRPPGATGTLTRDDGTVWQMKVTWKDG